VNFLCQTIVSIVNVLCQSIVSIVNVLCQSIVSIVNVLCQLTVARCLGNLEVIQSSLALLLNRYLKKKHEPYSELHRNSDMLLFDIGTV